MMMIHHLFFVFAFIIVLAESTLNGRFIHLTDTHLLRVYGPGTSPSMGCVAGSSKGSSGIFGDYQCDTVKTVLNFTKESLKHQPKPDFILYGGDHIAVMDPKQSIEDTEWFINDISQFLREVRDAYGPDVRVFPMLGNHDTYPPYQFPKSGPFYIYEAAAEAWADFLQPESLKTVRIGGYYTELIEPGLRIVVINTAMYFRGNIAIYLLDPDPGGQLAWFRGVLQKAKEAGESVFVAAHCPPGSYNNEKLGMWNRFNDHFVHAYEGYNGNPVVASFFGHHHWTSYRILSNQNVKVANNENSHVAFLSNSLSPRPMENPAFTEYTYMTKAPYTVLDRSYQYIDLDEANRLGVLKWKKGKSYRELFGIDKLDVNSLSDALNRMHDDEDLFLAFYEDLFTYSPAGGRCNSEGCRHATLCSINNTLSDQVPSCTQRPSP